jgi:catechol 2,3-dioxygenase-like lactoylglutathione lyase family enzyme
MFKIGKLFHLTQVVDDLERVDRWYDDVFSVERFYNGYEELAGRDASLIAIGDVIMEPMTPAKVEPLKNPSVKRFHERFGQHLHSVAWYVDDVQAISARLDGAGFRLFNLVGRQVKPPHKAAAVWTHPRETPGQLEFAVYADSLADPRMKPGWSTERWRKHPLGIEGASSIGIAVRDMTKAKRLYCDVLGGTLLHEESIAGRKKSAFVAIGEDSVVELAEPLTDDSVEGRELGKNGEGIYSLNFKTNSLQRASEFLRSKGHRPIAEGNETIVLDAEQAFGMRLGFTQRALPNDARESARE